MQTIATRSTFDGARYLLVEERNGNLAICDGNGIVPTRSHLSPRAWLAVWGDLSVLASDELPGALRRVAVADREGHNVRDAIHAPAIRAEAERVKHAARRAERDARHLTCARAYCECRV